MVFKSYILLVLVPFVVDGMHYGYKKTTGEKTYACTMSSDMMCKNSGCIGLNTDAGREGKWYVFFFARSLVCFARYSLTRRRHFQPRFTLSDWKYKCCTGCKQRRKKYSAPIPGTRYNCNDLEQYDCVDYGGILRKDDRSGNGRTGSNIIDACCVYANYCIDYQRVLPHLCELMQPPNGEPNARYEYDNLPGKQVKDDWMSCCKYAGPHTFKCDGAYGICEANGMALDPDHINEWYPASQLKSICCKPIIPTHKCADVLEDHCWEFNMVKATSKQTQGRSAIQACCRVPETCREFIEKYKELYGREFHDKTKVFAPEDTLAEENFFQNCLVPKPADCNDKWQYCHALKRFPRDIIPASETVNVNNKHEICCTVFSSCGAHTSLCTFSDFGVKLNVATSEVTLENFIETCCVQEAKCGSEYGEQNCARLGMDVKQSLAETMSSWIKLDSCCMYL
jgi:hypothetical protein